MSRRGAEWPVAAFLGTRCGVLFGRSLADKQVLFTWAFGVVPFGFSLRAPDMSLDMRVLTVSDETADSDGSESIAVGLSEPLA